MTNTDYKRLWRGREKKLIELDNIIFGLKKVILSQADLIANIRDGVVKPEELLKETPEQKQMEETVKWLKETNKVNES